MRIRVKGEGVKFHFWINTGALFQCACDTKLAYLFRRCEYEVAIQPRVYYSGDFELPEDECLLKDNLALQRQLAKTEDSDPSLMSMPSGLLSVQEIELAELSHQVSQPVLTNAQR